MKIELETILPEQIENRSFAIIESELPKDRKIDALQKPVIKRVIHTTADFDYLDNLKSGACIVTDTNMAKAGVHKASLEKLGGALYCYMADEDVAAEAKRQGCTRAAVCMEKAAKLDNPLIIAVGNAPTALVRLCELISEGKLKPALVIGAPVGFVNVVRSKELIMQAGVDYIVAAGRKGGSNVAAAICNALIYMATGER